MTLIAGIPRFVVLPFILELHRRFTVYELKARPSPSKNSYLLVKLALLLWLLDMQKELMPPHAPRRAGLKLALEACAQRQFRPRPHGGARGSRERVAPGPARGPLLAEDAGTCSLAASPATACTHADDGEDWPSRWLLRLVPLGKGV